MESPLVASLIVSRGVIILAEYSNTLADYSPITTPILERLTVHRPLDGQQRIFTHPGHHVHLLPKDGLFFVVISDEKLSAQLASNLLNEMAKAFIKVYQNGGGKEESSTPILPYSMNEFSKTLAVLLKRWMEEVVIVDPILRNKKELDQVQNILVTNVEKLFIRGDRLKELEEQTIRINSAALEFQRNSIIFRRSLWWKNGKIMSGYLMAVGLFIFLFLESIYGSPV